MQHVRRNDKVHQRQELEANREACEVLAQLHGLVGRPGRRGLRVGQMVKWAASMGLLEDRNAKTG